MRSLLVTVICVLNLLCSIAQQVVITGSAKDFAGKQAVLFKDADLVSGKREVIAVVNISEEGNFQFNFASSETQRLFLSISRIEGALFVEPRHNYDIAFPEGVIPDAKRFDRSEISLDLSKLFEHDLNLLIRRFNADYIKFIAEHYYDFVSDEFRGSDLYRSTLGNKTKKTDIYKMPNIADSLKKEELSDFPVIAHNFIKDMESKYQPYYSNEYFKDYVTYSLAEIKLLSGLNRKKFYKEYFHQEPILYNNTAYMKCADLFYRNYFSADNNAKLDSLSTIINGASSMERLSKYFSGDSTMQREDIRKLALLINLKSAYHDKLYFKTKVSKTLASTDFASDTQTIIANNILHQATRYDKGSKGEDFTVGDTKEEKWQLSSNISIPIYLFFFASWNTASIKELMVLEKLYPKYKNDIKIVAVCMDDDYSAFKKFVREHKTMQFSFVYGAGDPLMTEKYNIRAIPSATFLDEEGKRISQQTLKPSEGVEDDFKRSKSINTKPSQGRGTWNKKN